MTPYEWLRWLTFPIRTVHLQTVRNDIKQLVSQSPKSEGYLSILDVGGRKSPYTIGVGADVTLLDVPQEEGARKDLNLGFTDSILKGLQKRRSNITDLIIQDMTRSQLPDNAYDAVVCVEVIEHVEADALFVENIAKVIKPSGWAYFTTPNGDYIKNEGPGKNPDHVRHYTKDELHTLLKRYFDKVDVHYAVKTGKYRVMGLKGFRKEKPFRIFTSIFGNTVNKIQSKGLKDRKEGTAHLIAIAFKS